MTFDLILTGGQLLDGTGTPAVAADLGIVVVPIYTGSLSEAGGPADTYDRFMRTNVERIVTALGS